MKKEDLFKQWEELKAKEEDIDCIILYIHMPTGEEEVIVNPNVVDKMQYIGKTYNDDLIHANCKDIYITDVIFSVNDDSCMDFEEALALMKEGHKVKLPSWGGYWSWDQDKETVTCWLMTGCLLRRKTTTVPNIRKAVILISSTYGLNRRRI